MKKVKIALPTSRFTFSLKIVMAIVIGTMLTDISNSLAIHFWALGIEDLTVKPSILIIASVFVVTGLLWIFFIKLRWDKKDEQESQTNTG